MPVDEKYYSVVSKDHLRDANIIDFGEYVK